MPIPIYYPDWATQTTTLPGTGRINKVRPKQTIRDYGMDCGQMMTCEEMNWWLNNVGSWIRYLVDEFIPTLPNTYLPLKGTKITLAQDATGSATFNGRAEITIDVNVTDNSHNHVSANITDASVVPTPNVLVKRGTGAQIYGGDFISRSTSAGDAGTYFTENLQGQRTGNISSTPNSGGTLSITRVNPTTGAGTAGITLFDAGYVAINNPRSANSQETNGASLVRYDYLNNRINQLDNTASRATNGWFKDTSTGMIFQWGTVSAGDNSFILVNLPIAFPNACLNLSVTGRATSSIPSAAVWAGLGNIVSRSQIRVGVNNSDSSATVGVGLYWFAVGY